MQYRREIDGLRALAVIPVILFHAGFKTFGGGYVGVDVFFVISGYLITGIILAEMESGSFSLARFYERRARRILPALFFVITACIPFALLWSLPNDVKEFWQSVATVSVFSSNILFWQQSGYFDTAAELRPLWHTWSLAVEEQFYVLFPLFLMLAWRLGKRWMIALLVGIALASLAFAQWTVQQNPSAAFFLLPSRMWELAIGAFLAFHFLTPREGEAPRALREAGCLAGLAMLAYAVFAFDSNTPYPSLFTLLPTVGTALIILFARPQTYVCRILASKPLVGVGLISYSAYLWHQPLFAFARQRSLVAPSAALLGLLAAAALLLAYFSWRYVEQPFRTKDRFRRKEIFIFAGTASAAFAVLGLAGNAAIDPGQVSSTTTAKQTLEHRIRVNFGLSDKCEKQFTLAPECRTSEAPEVLLWGDSYAMHLAQGFLASRPDIKMIQMTISLCGPVFGAAPMNQQFGKAWGAECIANNDKVLAYLKQSRSIKYAVLASPFRQYASDDWKLMLRGGEVVASKSHAPALFRETLAQLKALGIKPVIIAPTPRNGNNIGQCLVNATLRGRDLDLCDVRLEQDRQDDKQTGAYELLHKLEADAKVVWLTDGLCVAGVCRAAVDGTLMFRDNGHLSFEGSAHLGRAMDFYKQVTSD